jgi:hypothetical protein
MICLTEQGKELQLRAAQVPFNLLKKLNMTMTEAEIADALELKSRLYKIIDTLEVGENKSE